MEGWKFDWLLDSSEDILGDVHRPACEATTSGVRQTVSNAGCPMLKVEEKLETDLKQCGIELAPFAYRPREHRGSSLGS